MALGERLGERTTGEGLPSDPRHSSGRAALPRRHGQHPRGVGHVGGREEFGRRRDSESRSTAGEGMRGIRQRVDEHQDTEQGDAAQEAHRSKLMEGQGFAQCSHGTRDSVSAAGQRPARLSPIQYQFGVTGEAPGCKIAVTEVGERPTARSEGGGVRSERRRRHSA